ncbi:HAD family hydrolase [Phytohabitans houttuyneae]|uniref:HAD family hydrolase n=1 Tax=Phytohabitans houttuyneae TaxID=1076126 RepID=UPI001567238A|nr:HAD family phosphatase [Phytohabitans houttuyneae]
MSAADSVAGLLARRGPLLLDFDGPVCSIFAGYPARTVAGDLVALIGDSGVSVPAEVAEEQDPLEVLRWVGRAGDQRLVTMVEDALCAAEVRAVATAEPTPYGREVIVGARQVGLPVAVVSNNSAGAVTSYLAARRLAGHVHPVAGRAYADPARMKPSPDPILRAASALGVDPAQCVLIGDSLTDIDGGRAAGVPVIGYANRPWKIDRFAVAGADVVVTSMGEVADALMSLLKLR